MQTVTKAILVYNRGRDAERLKIKLAAIRADVFAFFRGTCPLFYSTLRLDRSLAASPAVLACGDLHLQNFGSYKGDNRLVYFDMNDFDESCVAPVAFDLVRLLTSILIAAKSLGIGDKAAREMVATFIGTYAANVISTKPRWVERSLATGPVKKLLHGVEGRHRRDLIKTRTHRKSGKVQLIIDGKRTLAASTRDRARAAAILAAYAKVQSSPAFFTPMDMARRVAGNGSLGLERYVALVQGHGGSDGQYLIDIKLANASALAASINNRQPRWKNEAERVVAIQRVMQAIAPALLGWVAPAGMGARSYLIKELQPTVDRIDLSTLREKHGAWNDAVRSMAEVTAWGHLRGCSRFEADSMDALSSFVARTEWRSRIADCAQRAMLLVMQQWQRYAKDYDAGADQLMSAALEN